jgi:sugar (pentulose or hexulose) kinase
MSVLLGIDFGTGGAKAALLSADGEVVAYAYQEYPLIHERPGWSEHDALRYWPIAADLIACVLRQGGVNGSQVAAVGASCALPSLVTVDGSGAVVGPAINLLDRRARTEAGEVVVQLGAERLADVTANRIEDHPSIVNLLWLRRHRPDVWERIRWALTIDGYTAFRLTGAATVNRSAAAFYGVAFDIRRGIWDKQILDELDLPVGLLPEVVDCRSVIGGVTAQAAEDTGLREGTPVVGGQVDCNAGWIAGGAVEPGDAQLNLGTCGVLGVVHDREGFLGSPSGRLMVNIPYTTDPERVYSAVATTMTGGQALRYLRETFGYVEAQVGSLLGVDPYDLLTLQARDVPPGSAGLVVLPYLMGERTPIWDPAARGVVFGLSLHHTRGHIFRAFMEGVSYALAHSFEQLVAGGLQVNFPLVLNEGGARSEVWRRIITDVLGVPTAVLTTRAGAPVGDAVLAGVATGVLEDFSVTKQWARCSAVLEPDPGTHRRYQEFYGLYRQLYEDLQRRFEDLEQLVGGA